MKNKIGFLNIEERNIGDITWKGFPVGKMGVNKLKIDENIHDLTPPFRQILTDTSDIPLEKLNYKDNKIFNKILESPDFENYKAIRCESKSSRYRQSKTIFEKHSLEGQGVKIIIPSNIIDIYTRLEILLGLKLSGQTDTITEASNLIGELYKRGEIQNKQQYRNALNKYPTS